MSRILVGVTALLLLGGCGAARPVYRHGQIQTRDVPAVEPTQTRLPGSADAIGAAVFARRGVSDDPNRTYAHVVPAAD